MPIMLLMKLFVSVIIFFLAFGLFAAPLDGGFNLITSAAAEDKDQVFVEARNRVIDAAAKYLNTPYRYGGISSSGLDCSGLIYVSFRDALGVSLPRSTVGLYTWVERISFDNAQPGDLLFFKTDSTGNISHVGLYLGGRRFIHSASAGPNTGVIYSTLDERYWSRTFAGAGRAFPEVTSQIISGNSTLISETGNGGVAAITNAAPERRVHLLLGAAFAPTWNGFIDGGDLIRGFSSQLRLGADTSFLGLRMILGLELRPEYDGALGVFRLPLTLSWGLNDKIRIFAGPVLSLGAASLSTDDGERFYSGGTSWLGTIGITAAPVIISTSRGEFAPYLEAAWQSYFSDSPARNFNADLSAGLRFSTGIRWTIQR